MYTLFLFTEYTKIHIRRALHPKLYEVNTVSKNVNINTHSVRLCDVLVFAVLSFVICTALQNKLVLEKGK